MRLSRQREIPGEISIRVLIKVPERAARLERNFARYPMNVVGIILRDDGTW